MNVYNLVYVYHNNEKNINYVTCRTSTNKRKVEEDAYTLYREVLRSECIYRNLLTNEHMLPDEMKMILDKNNIKYTINKIDKSIEIIFDNGDTYYCIMIKNTEIDVI